MSFELTSQSATLCCEVNSGCKWEFQYHTRIGRGATVGYYICIVVCTHMYLYGTSGHVLLLGQRGHRVIAPSHTPSHAPVASRSRGKKTAAHVGRMEDKFAGRRGRARRPPPSLTAVRARSSPSPPGAAPPSPLLLLRRRPFALPGRTCTRRILRGARW